MGKHLVPVDEQLETGLNISKLCHTRSLYFRE